MEGAMAALVAGPDGVGATDSFQADETPGSSGVGGQKLVPNLLEGGSVERHHLRILPSSSSSSSYTYPEHLPENVALELLCICAPLFPLPPTRRFLVVTPLSTSQPSPAHPRQEWCGAG